MGKVDPVTHNKFIRDFKADPVGLNARFAACGFVEKGNGAQFARLTALQKMQHMLQRKACIDNIFDDQHIAAFDLAADVF